MFSRFCLYNPRCQARMLNMHHRMKNIPSPPDKPNKANLNLKKRISTSTTQQATSSSVHPPNVHTTHQQAASYAPYPAPPAQADYATSPSPSHPPSPASNSTVSSYDSSDADYSAPTPTYYSAALVASAASQPPCQAVSRSSWVARE